MLVNRKIVPMGKQNYFGAQFKEHPEWKNDGVFHIEDEAIFSGLFRTANNRKVGKLHKKQLQENAPKHDMNLSVVSIA